jgi:drug/metabolite transporter (DMT)-like permease
MSALRTRAPATTIPRTRAWGVTIAFATAVISGCAVFLNGYGVRAFGNPTLYTTMKNLVAAVVLIGLLAATTARRSPEGFTRPRGPRQWVGLVVIGVIGGSVPFVLFFEGLARAGSTDAAFLQKTLVLWVVLLAVPLLRERIGPLHVAAIGLLLWGQAALQGGVHQLGLGSAEGMILAATLLWSVEIVVAKRLLGSLSALTVGAARMGIGVVALIGYSVARGYAGDLAALGPSAWGWVLATGVILAAYVATWYAALARAQAVDVTAVLVFGAVVTAMLNTGFQGAALGSQVLGLVLVTVGAGAAATLALRRPRAPEAA